MLVNGKLLCFGSAAVKKNASQPSATLTSNSPALLLTDSATEETDLLVRKAVILGVFALFLLVRAWHSFYPTPKNNFEQQAVLSKQAYMQIDRTPLAHIYQYTVPEVTLLAAEGGYTWQLIVMSNLDELKHFIDKQHLKTDRVAYFRSNNNGHQLYTLVYGHYDSKMQANRVLQTLPPTVKKLQPRLRSMVSVHSAILHRHS